MNQVRNLIVAIRAVIYVMEVLLCIRVFCEFKAVPGNYKPFRFLIAVTEPLLDPVRKILNKQSQGRRIKFDISPIVVIIILYVVKTVLKSLL
jgi:YggT family protein